MKHLTMKTKNLLRGLQGRGPDAASLRTLDSLRKGMGVDEAEVVSNWLHGSQVYSGLNLPPEFPTSPANRDNFVSLESMTLPLEIAVLKARQIAHEQKLIDFIEGYGRVNDLINALDLSLAVDQIEDLTSEFGYSIRLLLKVSYIYTHAATRDDVQERCKRYLDSCGMSTRNFVARGVVDVLSTKYPFLSIRRNIASRGQGNNKTRFSNDIGEWLFFPVQRTADGFAAQLRSQRQASLIDATFTLFENTLNLDNGHRFNLQETEFVASPLLKNTWLKIAGQSVPDLLQRSEGKDDRTFQIYRDSISWLEISKISKFRARVDVLYRDPQGRAKLRDTYGRELNREFYNGVSSLEELCVGSNESAALEEKFLPHLEGNFGRTLALIHLISSPTCSKDLSTSQLLTLMNTTQNVETLLDAADFDLILEAGEDDPLFKVIILTLKSQHSGSPRAASRLRTSFEALVLTKYEGDLIGFFASLHLAAPQVAEYLFELCDEQFLDLLYGVVPEGQSVLLARANLLTWYAEAYDEGSFAERARMMQIDERIQRVRGTFDDIRIYIDKLRFTHWLQDNYLDELAAISRDERPSADSFDLNDFGNSEHAFSPEVRLAKLLQATFTKFCENPSFGIASYIGRRIRHGTLEGILNSRIEEITTSAKETEFVGNPQACLFLDDWLGRYKVQVEKLGTEYLQIYSPKNKPKGLIDTNIWAGPKLLTTRGSLKGLFEQLDESKLAEATNGVLQACWQLLQSELTVIRKHFVSSRISWGVINASDFPANSNEEKKIASAFCARINNVSDELFKSVASWFHQPQDMVPSAPLSLVFDAVVKEVQERFTTFNPAVKLEGLSEITLTGGTYHIVYDALFILLGNAAKHGPNDAEITRKFDFVLNASGERELLVSISSLCLPSDLEIIRSKMEVALASDISDANEQDKNSGFKKLVHLKEFSRELKRMEYSTDNGEFSVDLFFELLA